MLVARSIWQWLLPLTAAPSHQTQWPFLFQNSYEHLHESTQQPCLPSSPPTKFPIAGVRKTTSLEIEMNRAVFGFPTFSTNIAIGNPPQPFRLFLDLGYGGLPVRSIDCQDISCGDLTFTYNSTASITSEALGNKFSLSLPGQNARGALFRDDAWLVSIPLHNVTIGAVDEFYGENFFYLILADIMDGAIGLAPPNATSLSYPPLFWRSPPHPHPNLMHDLTSSGALERNIMILSLPKNPDAKGKLTLGEEPARTDFRIPMSQRVDTPSLVDTWKVDMNHISILGSVPLELPLNLTAAITLEPDFALSLPKEYTEIIWEYTGAKRSEFFDGGIVDCDMRQEFPDLVLVLGRENITLTWRDYTHRYLYGGQPVCAVAIEWPYNYDEMSAQIGLLILQKFDIIFDMERQELGLITI